MTVSKDDIAAAGEFPAVTRAQWQSLVAGVLAKAGKPDLAGAEAERALATEVEDGLRVQPLYTAEDSAPDPGWPGFAPYTRARQAQGSATAGWDVRQQFADPDPARANESVLADLENGVTSVWLTLGHGGLPVAALPDVLKGVYLDLISVVLDAGAEFPAAARELFALYAAGPGSVPASGNLGADPLGLLARTGSDADTAAQLAEAAELAARCTLEFPGVRALVVDALPYHDAGASAAQELGFSLSTAVAYLRRLTEAGLTADAAAGQLEFRYAAGADQFLTIAKLRAARRLWARVASVCEVGPAFAGQRQHAVTSAVMMTERDPWVNMLRTTVACLGAGLGGADAVTAAPFDSALGLPDDFARRVARNTQSILLEESNLARVIDPAGGSWYVEQLTDQLAQAGWDWFQQAERAGGQLDALRDGTVAGWIAANWAKRTALLDRRREAVTGVSEFPNLAERPVVRAPAPPRPDGGLPRVRRAAAFEALRSASDAELEETGSRPRIALVALGPVAGYTARSAFAANLFQAGGIETVLSEAGGSATSEPDLAGLVAAFTGSGARAACICSSDKLYTAWGEAVAAALKAAGARHVVLAGRPSDAYREAGVDDFVYLGCDAVAALTAAFDKSRVDESGASA